MPDLQYSLFDAFTREQRLDPARKLAARLGHAEVDFQHLLWIDTEAADGLLRPLIGDHTTGRNGSTKFGEFRNGLLENYLSAGSARLESQRIPFAAPVCAAAEALVNRSAPPGSNLEKVIAAQASFAGGSNLIEWPVFLAALLDYRPHRIVPYISADFGLASDGLLEGARLPRVSGREVPSNPADDPLSIFTLDLTAEATKGRIDEVIGRDAEIDRLMTILSQKVTNNPILLGDAGVGKTKIVEGLAVRIALGRVHPRLLNKRLLSLDIGLLVAGTQYRGQFEDRLKSLLRALQHSEGGILMFIDEVHQLLGLGQTSGAMDAANLMKPALARGELRCIGATTYEEFSYFERDAALRRRFQPINVSEPNELDTATIIERIAPSFEAFHAVRYNRECIQSVVTLGRRYLGELHSPAREIGLLDEVGAKASLAANAEIAGRASLPEVSDDDVRAAISRRTGIPVEKMTAGRQQHLLNLEDLLGARIFGQDFVVRSVARMLRRGMVGLGHPGRPRAVFLFAGPSGVGKTELAKAIAELLYDGPDSIIRFDMSEFSVETSRNRLIGSDPGYVGSEEGGVLTNAVRRRPFSLVLLDEFEKAHPNVWRLFLQVIDEGRLTDGKGRTIKFNEAVIVMTSNAGGALVSLLDKVERQLEQSVPQPKAAELDARLDQICQNVAHSSSTPELVYPLLRSGAASLVPSDDQMHDNVMLGYAEMVKQSLLGLPGFPPELLSRIGMPLVFSPLTSAELGNVLNSHLIGLVRRIAAVRGFAEVTSRLDAKIKLETDERGGRECSLRDLPDARPAIRIILTFACVTLLLKRGQDTVLGARALRTLFETEVESAVADELLRVGDGAKSIDLVLDENGGKIVAGAGRKNNKR